MSEIPLLQPVIDRFDLKFILQDSKDEQVLRDYADAKTKLLTEKIPDYCQYIKKYVAYAKQLNPVITEEPRLLLNECYVNLSISLSESNPNFGSKRVLESLIRIAKSISKLKLKVVVDVEDVKQALRFYNALIYQYLESTVLIPDDPKNIAISVFIDILKNSAFAYTLEELAKTACEKNDYVKSYLLGGNKNNNYKHLLKIENNRKLRSTYELLIENPNIKKEQEKPIVLQWINPISSSPSDISDTTDTAKKEINCNTDNINVEKSSDMSDRSDTSSTKNNNGVEITITKNEKALDNIEIEKILKSEPRMGYKELLYYCKECPKVQNINHEEIKNHLLYSNAHKPS